MIGFGEALGEARLPYEPFDGGGDLGRRRFGDQQSRLLVPDGVGDAPEPRRDDRRSKSYL